MTKNPASSRLWLEEMGEEQEIGKRGTGRVLARESPKKFPAVAL